MSPDWLGLKIFCPDISKLNSKMKIRRKFFIFLQTVPTNPMKSAVNRFKEVWDYCHYRHKVLDYLLQTMNNSPHLRTYHANKGTIILTM